jgi:hypothetical protein
MDADGPLRAVASVAMAMMRPIRRPAVAGSWYPRSAAALATEVDRHVEAAGACAGTFDRLVGLVAPHAGLIYSGPVAAYAYAELSRRRVGLAVLVGPSHFESFDGVAIVARGGFETPLGVAEIDEACAADLMSAGPFIREHARAHQREHSLEMQLPFLQRLLPGVRIVPLLMGWQTADTARALGDALSLVLRDQPALLVASTDLSHYENARIAAALDGVVIDCVDRFDPDLLQRALDRNPRHACGGGPLVAVMRAARALGASDARVLKYADSGDVSGDKSSVVGYLAAGLGNRTSGAP